MRTPLRPRLQGRTASFAGPRARRRWRFSKSARERQRRSTSWGSPSSRPVHKFHVNVLQKVPLSADRNSVPDSFRRHVRTLVLNATANTLSKEEAASKWAQEALEDDRVSVEAVLALMDAQWGKDRFSQDPTDPEGEKIGISRRLHEGWRWHVLGQGVGEHPPGRRHPAGG